MKTALVSLGIHEVWVLIDLRPNEDTVIASRVAVCDACGQISSVPAGLSPVPGERWATLTELPELLWKWPL